MAFDESLAARIRDALARKRSVEEKKMFGWIQQAVKFVGALPTKEK